MNETPQLCADKASDTSRWNDDGGAQKAPNHVLVRDDQSRIDMAQFGIVAVPLTHYRWGGYSYTSLKDAIAAAKWSTSRNKG